MSISSFVGSEGWEDDKEICSSFNKNLGAAISVLDKPDFDYNMTTVGYFEDSGSCNALS